MKQFFLDFLHIYFPKVYIRVKHLVVLRKKGCFSPPETLPEKLLWLSITDYWDNEVIKVLEDKFRVRTYLEEKGYGGLLTDLIGSWNNVDDIRWEDLPASYAMKLNVGSGCNIICHNNNIDVENAKDEIRKWMKKQPLRDQINADGKNVEKVIICEEYIGDIQGNTPIDYKFYCFNGKPKAILVIWDRYEKKKAAFMDCNWNLICDMSKKNKRYSEIDVAPQKPKCLAEMVNIASKLCEKFPFVRVDLYEYFGKTKFGEFTFFPGDCAGVSETDVDGMTMGQMLRIKK